MEVICLTTITSKNSGLENVGQSNSVTITTCNCTACAMCAIFTPCVIIAAAQGICLANSNV